MTGHNCPTCGSDNTRTGAFVLECLTCGWHYLNANPCRVCGGPSRSVMSVVGVDGTRKRYGCAEHPLSKVEFREGMDAFAAVLVEMMPEYAADAPHVVTDPGAGG